MSSLLHKFVVESSYSKCTDCAELVNRWCSLCEACGECGYETSCPGKMIPSSSPPPPADAKKVDTSAIKQLLKEYFDASTSSVSNFQKVLEKAISTKNALTIEQAVESFKDGNARTALHFCAISNQLDVVKYIMSITKNQLQKDVDGYNPFSLAVLNSNIDISEELFSHNEKIINEKIGKSGNQKIIHSVCLKGLHEMLSWLLKKDPLLNVNEDSIVGNPLCCASSHDTPSYLKCLEILVNQKADVNKLSNNVTPLIVSLISGSYKSTSFLIDNGADPMICMEGGVSPLHIAAESGNRNSVELFIKLPNAKVLLNKTTNDIGISHHKAGLKPIHYAAGRKHKEIVDLLLPLTDGLNDVTSDFLIAEQEATGDWKVTPTESDDAIKPIDVSLLKMSSDEDKKLSIIEKEKGNECFAKKDWLNAALFYSSAIELDGHNAILYSNRSAAYLNLDKPKDALIDARTSKSLDKNYYKAYFREGQALDALHLYEEAANSYYGAVEICMNENNIPVMESMKTKMMKSILKAKEALTSK